MPRRRKKEHEANRNEAIAAGLDRYQGAPCKHGHPGIRFISTKGECIECYDIRKKAYYPKYKDHAKARYRAQRELHMWRRAEQRAKRDGLPFNIEVDDITIPDKCPVLGIPMTKPSLDRRNNELGYVKGNVFVISHRANSLKGDATVADLEALLRYTRGY